MSQQSAPVPAGTPGWKVVSVVDATGLDATGSYVKGRNVTYQLATGPAGTVFIPLSVFGTEAATAAITADAAKLYAVSQLKG